MKSKKRWFVTALTACLTLSLGICAEALEYDFDGVEDTEYYPSTSYESLYGAKYNYGGSNATDYQWQALPYPRRKVREMVLLLGCVDNNRTRQLCHEAFKKSIDLIYIDSGNGSYTGQVVCGVRKNGRTVRRPIGGVHPEMLKITDRFPSEVSCAEAAQADPQSIVANVTAATAVLTMVYNILTHGENLALQTDFSTRTIRMQTVLEKQPRRKAA